MLSKRTMMVQKIKDKVLAGGCISEEEAEWLYSSADLTALFAAAKEITFKFNSDKFEMCSIVNAKSGKCSEDCAWCAQSAKHESNCEVYPLLEYDEIFELAKQNEAEGVKRFSLVCSGKRLSVADIEKVCNIVRKLKEETSLQICASLGLLDETAMKKLYEAGVSRYHCNLETAPSYFPELCSTHTTQDKLTTLMHAKKVGMEVCSGGIIGMGESAKQRIELAFALKGIDLQSVPVNILNPIKGTPLQDTKPLEDEDILRTLAVFRFILPDVQLRFAGGRRALKKEVVGKAMEIAVNSAIVGDMLTTLGNDVEEDKRMIKSKGYEL